jgi:hypothetical protein
VLACTLPMRRAVLLLMLALVLGPAVGLDLALGEDACAQDCPDDADGRQCPPLCPDCTCSLRPASLLPAGPPVIVLLPTHAPVLFSESERTPAIPEPREILHVPILVPV